MPPSKSTVICSLKLDQVHGQRKNTGAVFWIGQLGVLQLSVQKTTLTMLGLGL